jgi:hypothetical protein
MLPYDGMIRTGSKGVSHSVSAGTPSEGRKVIERGAKHKFCPHFFNGFRQFQIQTVI